MPTDLRFEKLGRGNCDEREPGDAPPPSGLSGTERRSASSGTFLKRTCSSFAFRSSCPPPPPPFAPFSSRYALSTVDTRSGLKRKAAANDTNYEYITCRAERQT